MSEEKSEHKYRLRWKFEFGEWTKEELAKDDTWSACDSMLFVSQVHPPDGSLSTFFIPKDGRLPGEMTDHEMFKIWTLLASRLGESKTLGEGEKRFCAQTFKLFCDAMMRMRK